MCVAECGLHQTSGLDGFADLRLAHIITGMGTVIEDLEVSVRTSMFLQSLGVTTLEELLAMPEIKAPHRMVAAELQELFDELEVGGQVSNFV
jgi:hypothetical protein